jgi:tetratricopeptide (TPR) repeat protein
MLDEEYGEGLVLANHYLEIGNDRAALDALDRVADTALSDPDYWLIRATALRGLDRDDEAVDAARRGLELDPEEISLLDTLALAELDRDRYVKAEEALVAALQLEPDHAVLHAHLALTLAHAKRYAEARAAIGRALELDPDHISVLRIRAQVALLAEDAPETVRRYVADLLERAPNDQTGHAVLGVLSARQKNYRQSARELAEAARIDPSNTNITRGAREARVYAHPVLAPVRPIWKFGRWRAYFVVIALSFTLAAAHQTTLREILLVAWLVIVVLSWFAPPILRRLSKRKYGG